MSKIGKKNILVPKESSVKIEGSNLTISGPKGTKKLTINDKVFSSKLVESEFSIEPKEIETIAIADQRYPSTLVYENIISNIELSFND